MKTIIILLDCKGDEKHPAHKEPVAMICLAEEHVDSGHIIAQQMALQLSYGSENLVEIDRSLEDVLTITDGLKKILLAGESEEVSIFDEVEEVGEKVEF